MALINEFNEEYKDNYDKYIAKGIDNLKNSESLESLDILKGIKEEKQIFENKIENICDNGTNSEYLNEVKDLLLKDNSDEQKI